MPTRRAHIAPHSPHGQLAVALEALREVNEVPDAFPPAVLAEAAAVAAAGAPPAELDLREIPFVTLDPAGSLDLDQAFHIEHGGGGFILRYAIADLPVYVRAGGAIDAEARLRGQTLYLPDGRVPLHPEILSEDRASLLPGVDRTAYVWTIPVDATGRAAFEGAPVAEAQVERALIRSTARLDYASTQERFDAGAAEGLLALLPAFAQLRIEQEQARGGASLNMPDEEIVRGDHGYEIVRGFPLPVEEWNAQLSLLTGMAAGALMLAGGIGIHRTMPAPEAEALAEFRTRVAALELPWGANMPYGEYLRTVPRDTARGIAVLHAAASLFRGADYAAFGVPPSDGGGGGSLLAPPPDPAQAAIAAPYAHVTAPLRRLVDRWGLVICEALGAGRPVPDWARDSLAELPGLMRASAARAGRLGSEALDRIEAALLRDRVGEVFPATVVEVRGAGARVQIEDPPITARLRVPETAPGAAGSPAPRAQLTAGTHTQVRVVRAEVPSGEIELEPA